jgi:hypothetical protein
MAHDESIFERVSEISSMLMEGDASVDETAGILRGVKMCGTVSPSNRRKWPADVLAAARERYEGAPCYVNHDFKNKEAGARKPRRLEDRLGDWSNVRATENGLIGDLTFNPHHPMAKSVGWYAKNRTKGVGFSHDVDWRYKRHADGIKEALEVGQVYSVDLVSGPGTAKNVYECEYDEDGEDSVTEQTGDLDVATEAEIAQENAALKAKLAKLESEKAAGDRLAASTTWAHEIGLEGDLATEAASTVASIADDAVRGSVTALIESVFEQAASAPAPAEEAADFEEDEEEPARKVKFRRSRLATPRSTESRPVTEAADRKRIDDVFAGRGGVKVDAKAAVSRWRG